jgi:hypothetical protein
MRRLAWLIVGFVGAALPAAAGDAPARRPVVAELFTSQGCSSCPPAEALLAEIAFTRTDVLALAFHVTYWDRLGWPDPFALPAATARQRAYAASLGLDELYTPELIVDGRRDVVGSDRAGVFAALASAAADAAASVPLRIARTEGGISVAVGTGAGQGALLLLGYDSARSTAVARGENGGRTLIEANVVRAMLPLGAWRGQPLVRAAPRPAGEHVAVLLQAPDGRILGAAALE